MKIQRTDYRLKMQNAFIRILENELIKVGLVSGSVVFNFRDPDYSAEEGGYHPVEIAVDPGGRISYITEFVYVGMPPFVELDKNLDFDFSLGLFQQMGRAYTIEHGWELFPIWQQNFCAYYEMGVYQVTVTDQ